MREMFLSMILAIFLTSQAFGQRSLEFRLLDSLTVPSTITGKYAVDLDNDRNREIILTTDNYFYIYGAPYHDYFYRSPHLESPRDLQFMDMNLDGLIDIAVHQDTNIFIVSPYDSTIIWASPRLDSLDTSCYTLGKIDSSNYNDIILVRKERFTRSGDIQNMDTVWTDVYRGPGFSLDHSYIMLMPNYDIGDYYYYSISHETPANVSIMNLTCSGEPVPAIVLFSSIGYTNFNAYNALIIGINGGMWIINYNDGTIFHADGIGRADAFTSCSANGTKSLFSYNSRGEMRMYQDGSRQQESHGYGYSHSADSLLASINFYNSYDEGSHWKEYLLADVNPNSPGMEFCYGWDQTLYCYALPGLTQSWLTVMPDYTLIDKPYRNSTLFSHAQIMLKNWHNPWGYLLRDGANGSLSATAIPEDYVDVSDIADINGDNEDEILFIDGNKLRIYSLKEIVGVAEDIVSKSAFLSSNYPNPFNSSTNIRFGLAERGEVTIYVYDLLGRKVETLASGIMRVGEHEITWDSKDHPSGIYFYSIKAPGLSQTRRMILLK